MLKPCSPSITDIKGSPFELVGLYFKILFYNMTTAHLILIKKYLLEYAGTCVVKFRPNSDQCFSFKVLIEWRGRIVGTSTSYSGGPGFKSWTTDQLSWLRFIIEWNKRIEITALRICSKIRCANCLNRKYRWNLINNPAIKS